MNEWLQARADQGLSAWTVQLEAKALGKLYGISPEDENYFNPPKRNREDIKRSRGDRVRDKHFSVTNNDELIKFCKGTGLRRSELGMLKGGDLVTKEEIEREIAALESVPVQERTPAEEKRLGVLQDTRLFDCRYYIHVRNGKGGRERVSPIVGKNAAQIVERIRNTPNGEKVWQHIHQSADIHGYEDLLHDKRRSGRQAEDLNIMLKPRLRANYKTGYWEVIFLHTRPLGLVPEDMRTRH